jgi:SAM-dependent methyltransferase
MIQPNLRAVSSYTIATYNTMETERDGVLTDDDRFWNLCHGPRNYETVRAIAEYTNQRSDIEHLTVVNISGLNEGKPDPVLFDLVCQGFDRNRLSWFVVDHPQSLTFTDPHVQRWTQERGIICVPHDHRLESGLPATPPADIVLCTEIIEHLDYSDTLRLLRSCRELLKPGGVLFVTTPNALFLGYRLMFVLGRWDFLFFNDDPAAVDHGLVGHIMYYDGQRLSRIMRLLQFDNVAASTFNAGHGPGEYRTIWRRIAANILRMATNLVPASGQVLRVVAQRPF